MPGRQVIVDVEPLVCLDCESLYHVVEDQFLQVRVVKLVDQDFLVVVRFVGHDASDDWTERN